MAPQGPAHVERLAEAIEDADSGLPSPVRELGALLFVQIAEFDEKIAELAADECPGNRVQQPHVLDVGPLAVRPTQSVIRRSERQRRKQPLPEAIPRKGARLADQARNDVAIVDPVVRRAPQPRHRAQHPAAVEDFYRRRMLTRLDHMTDQPRRHRVDPTADPDRAPQVRSRRLPPRRRRCWFATPGSLPGRPGTASAARPRTCGRPGRPASSMGARLAPAACIPSVRRAAYAARSPLPVVASPSSPWPFSSSSAPSRRRSWRAPIGIAATGADDRALDRGDRLVPTLGVLHRFG